MNLALRDAIPPKCERVNPSSVHLWQRIDIWLTSDEQDLNQLLAGGKTLARTLMMRRLQFLASVACACAAMVACTPPAVAQDADDGTVQASVSVCFMPGERCFDRIVNAIGAARSGIRVQAYGFTSVRIIGALAAAKRRGVVVETILDKTNLRQSSGAMYTGATYLVHADIPVWIDARPAIAHNKVIIIDQHLVIGGSANYTNAAETRNAENVLFIELGRHCGTLPRQLGGKTGRIPAVCGVGITKASGICGPIS